MKRRVEPELLDELPARDPRAARSRGDLQRLNRMMGHAGIVARILACAGNEPRQIVELGAGDGRFALDLAGRLASRWRQVNVVLVDRVNIVTEDTLESFRALNWPARVVQADVLDWLATANREVGACLVTNLFLHHFAAEKLRELLALAAKQTACFVACEPRRSQPVLAVSRLLGLIGCNAITRHDAVISVRAGFHHREISALWPADGGWLIQERRAGLFSHCFMARRSPLAF